MWGVKNYLPKLRLFFTIIAVMVQNMQPITAAPTVLWQSLIWAMFRVGSKEFFQPDPIRIQYIFHDLIILKSIFVQLSVPYCILIGSYRYLPVRRCPKVFSFIENSPFLE